MAKKAKKAKKASKPAKKAAAKKPAKKTAPKKVASKKPVSKTKSAKKPAKRVVAKKAAKPAKKTVAVKAKPAKAVAAKAQPKKEAAPVAAIKPVVPAVNKTVPVAKPQPKKKGLDLDDDEMEKKTQKSKSNEEFFEEFSYKPNIRKANANQPKPHIGADNRTRYSDEELAEFKELILEKLAEAQKDYELLKSTLSHKDDHGTDDTSPTFKLLEDGSDVLSKEETAQLAARQEKFIQNLKNALIRIENKTYGICRATGRLISKERLRSVPHATLDIDAKLEQSF